MAVPVRSHLDIHHHWLSSRPGPLRLTAARTLGVAGLIAYNWWVAAPFQPGWLRSSNALFSDLAASDQPHALTLQHLDLTAGLLLVSALLLRGPIGRSGSRPEWKWLVAFAAMASAGGAFPYTCASGLDHGCRSLERQMQLPPTHYMHMLAGIGEFVTITLALWIAYRRTRADGTAQAALMHFLVAMLVIAYPLLAVAYFGDRWGTIVEPMFFVAFTVLTAVTLFEPVGHPVAVTPVAVDTRRSRH
jgi:prepilin signal peptidase PulO-like enzyme (type II secretory pathway)